MIKIVCEFLGDEIFVPFVIEWKMPINLHNLPEFFMAERLFLLTFNKIGCMCV